MGNAAGRWPRREIEGENVPTGVREGFVPNSSPTATPPCDSPLNPRNHGLVRDWRRGNP